MVTDLNIERRRRADAAERDALERKLAGLKERQALRIAAVARQKAELDRVVADADREIANVEARLEGEGL